MLKIGEEIVASPQMVNFSLSHLLFRYLRYLLYSPTYDVLTINQRHALEN